MLASSGQAISPCGFVTHSISRFDQTIEAADSERSAFALQRLAYREESPKPHAADVCQLSQVDDQTSKSFRNAGSTMLFELRCVLSVHPAGDKEYHLV